MHGHRLGLMLVASTGYSALVGLVMLWRGMVATPDILLVAMVPLALLSGRFLTWLKDWVPFIGLLLGWEAMRSVADEVSASGVHWGSLRPELALFGGRLPEVWLQNLLDHGRLGAILNTAAATVDLMHFPAVVAVAFLIWLYGREAFFTYSLALFATAFAAFVVFVVAPTAPPWYAADHGMLPGLQHVMYQVLPVRWSAYYSALNANPVAANPSLHAALPFVGFLALLRLRSTGAPGKSKIFWGWSRLAWPMLAWCIAVWFSVVYLGEHYLLDVLAGVLLATLCSKLASLLRPLGHQLVTAVPAPDRHREIEAVRV